MVIYPLFAFFMAMIPTLYGPPPVAYESLKSGFSSDSVALNAVFLKVTVEPVMAVGIVLSLYFYFCFELYI